MCETLGSIQTASDNLRLVHADSRPNSRISGENASDHFLEALEWADGQFLARWLWLEPDFGAISWVTAFSLWLGGNVLEDDLAESGDCELSRATFGDCLLDFACQSVENSCHVLFGQLGLFGDVGEDLGLVGAFNAAFAMGKNLKC